MHRLNYILHCKHGGEDVLPEQWNFLGGNSNKKYTNFLTPPPPPLYCMQKNRIFFCYQIPRNTQKFCIPLKVKKPLVHPLCSILNING